MSGPAPGRSSGRAQQTAPTAATSPNCWLWDLATRVYPDDPVVPADDARWIRNGAAAARLVIARTRGPECPVEPLDVSEASEPAAVEGVRGTWRVDLSQLDLPSLAAQRCCHPSTGSSTTASAPSSSLNSTISWRCTSLLPSAGAGTSPCRSCTATGWRASSTTADRTAGGLRIHAIHQDVRFTSTMTEALLREITDLAHWLKLDLALRQ
jgi:uncharacterized protein